MSHAEREQASSGLDELLRTVAHATGLEPRKDWHARAADALDEVAAQRGLSSEHLTADRSAWPELIPSVVAAVTVQETFFFRHRTHFDALAELVATRLERGSRARVWSAGCATGEEPYSMAMAIAMRSGVDALPRVEILANDLSLSAIRRAERATYGAWSFREVPASSLARWLEGDAKQWRPVDEVRAAVRFEVADTLRVARSLPDRSLDAIFFRNVGIYLTPDAIAAIHAELARILTADGLFIVAPVDPRPAAHVFSVTPHPSTSVYQLAPPERLPAQPSPSRSERETLRVSRRPKREAAAPSVHSAPTVPAPRIDPSAIELADRGALEDAAHRLAGATAVSDLLVRGQIHVAAANREAAIRDFRMALYRDAGHRLARFWYVIALRDAGLAREALRQLRVLVHRLGKDQPTDAVEDGKTTALELLDAARAIEAELV